MAPEMNEAKTDEYRELLLQHARHPLRTGPVEAHNHRGSCKNPLCGDAVEVGLDLAGDIIKKIEIQTSGCGISIASSSLMTEMVEGQTIATALHLLKLFNEALTTPLVSATELSDHWPAELSLLRPLSRLRESPTRVPCALIGWYALKDALK